MRLYGIMYLPQTEIIRITIDPAQLARMRNGHGMNEK